VFQGLKIFKFYEHPEIRVQIPVMKTEFTRYHTLADSIKSFEEGRISCGAAFREAERRKLLCLLYSLRGVRPGLIHTEVCQDARVVAGADVPET